MKSVKAVFTKDTTTVSKVTLGIDLFSVSPGDKIIVKINGETRGEITDQEIDGYLEVPRGSRVELEPVAGQNSYFSYFRGEDPPFNIYQDRLVEAHFNS